MITKDCPHCGNTNKVKYNSALGYCNTKCQMASQTIKLIAAWLNNEISGTIKKGWQIGPAKFIRPYLLSCCDYACQECGWNIRHPDGSSTLQIHHLDNDASNNVIDNLRVLCPNCHSLTESFGRRNKSSTRYTKDKEG